MVTVYELNYHSTWYLIDKVMLYLLSGNYSYVELSYAGMCIGIVMNDELLD